MLGSDIYSDQLRELGADDNSGWEEFSQLQADLPAGTYYARVGKDIADAPVAEYSLSLSSLRVDPPIMRYGLGALRDATYSPDGRYLATAGPIGAVLWSVETGERLRVLSARGHDVNAVRISPDGAKVITAGADGVAIVWDAVTASEITRFTGHDGPVLALAVSVDGIMALTGGADGTARLWQTSTGAELQAFNGQSGPCSAVELSPDMASVLTGEVAGVARLWDVASGLELRQLPPSAGAGNYAVAFSPDGSRLLTVTADSYSVWIGLLPEYYYGGVLDIYAADTGQLIRSITPPYAAEPRSRYRAVFSPDGRHILSGGPSNDAYLYDVDGVEQVRSYAGHAGQVTAVSFAPDGARVLTGGLDQDVRIWEEATGAPVLHIAEHSEGNGAVAVSGDGRLLATGGQTKTAIVWESTTGRRIRTLQGGYPGEHLDLSLDGSRLLSMGAKVVYSSFMPYTSEGVQLWDSLAGGAPLFTNRASISGFAIFEPKATGAYDLSPDGSRVAWRNKLIDAATGDEVTTFPEAAAAVAFSPDGSLVAFAIGADTLIRHASSGDGVTTLTGHTGVVAAVAFSADSALVLTGGDDGTARLWIARTGQELDVYTGHSGRVMAVAFSTDGRRAATGGADQSARVWSTASGAELRTFHGHTGAVDSVAFSLDGKLALAGCGGQSARLWDVERGAEIRSFVDSGQAVFLPDGTRIATGGPNGMGRLWTANPSSKLNMPAGTPQFPWLDDNGDGAPSTRDGTFARQRVFGDPSAFGFLIPEIVAAQDDALLASPEDVEVWCEMGPGEVGRVEVAIAYAGADPRPGAPISGQQIISLTREGSTQKWSAILPGSIFSEEGSYSLLYTAARADDLGVDLTAAPVARFIHLRGQAPGSTYLDVTGDGKIDIGDVLRNIREGR